MTDTRCVRDLRAGDTINYFHHLAEVLSPPTPDPDEDGWMTFRVRLFGGPAAPPTPIEELRLRPDRVLEVTQATLQCMAEGPSWGEVNLCGRPAGHTGDHEGQSVWSEK